VTRSEDPESGQLAVAPAGEPGGESLAAAEAPAEYRWSARSALTIDVLFVPVTLLILVVWLSISTDTFLTEGNIKNVLTQMAVLAIVSFGVTIVMIGGGFDLSVGSQVAFHGSLGAIVMAATDSILIGVLAGLGSGAAYGAVNGLLVAGLSINPFIVTLGTLVIGEGAALAITDSRPVTGLPEGLREFGLGEPLGFAWIVWLMLACFLLAAFILHVTPFGLKVFATGGNREAARLSGLRVNRIVFATFVISGIFAAIAGLALTARLRSGQPTVGGFLELYAVAAVVLGGTSLYGGRGAMWRTLLGVVLIAVIQNGLNLLNVAEPYQNITVGTVFIVAASTELARRVRLRSLIRRRLNRGRAGPAGADGDRGGGQVQMQAPSGQTTGRGQERKQ
jgi:ribose/xylose/arabinose/galactoside ABC-type transport system permease subunit